jgi:hypothetical protein
MGSSFLLASNDFGTSMPFKSLEESISLLFKADAFGAALTPTLGVSVMETQLGYLQLVTFNPIHHAVLIRNSA